ncbi:MAG: formate dehydrogenase accessory protein FdhE [Syntrophomonas sp.]|nr:formate dehydrogenase accessory protein FdhE [Syntrophomonas sp.]
MNTKLPVDLPQGYVDFYKDLETWQNQQQIRLKKEYAPPAIDVQKLLANTKKSIMQTFDFELDFNIFQEVYTELLMFLKQARPETSEVLDKILFSLDKLDFTLLPAKVLEEDGSYFSSLANDLGVSQDMLIFTVDHAVRPFLRMWAAPYQKTIFEAGFNFWDFPTICPFCASKSHFSRILAADGRRFMFCDRCFTEWETPTVYCVHCGNSNPLSIQYLSVEDDLAYQVYTCDECKGYIKNFDERQKPIKLDMFIANIETVYLDILAQEKGYTSHDND